MEIELPDGTVLEAPDDADPSKVARAYMAKQKPAAQPESSGVSPWISAAMRPIIQGVTAFPGLAADAGIGLRNVSEAGVNKFAPKVAEGIYGINRKIAGGSEIASAILPQGKMAENYPMLTEGFWKEMDRFYTPPETTAGKASEFVSSVLAGSAMPAPQAARLAPQAFVKPAQDLVRQSTLAASQKAGYVVPPSTTNPTVSNKVLESIGGKIATEQDAALKNQSVTNALAKKALGLTEDAPITKEAIGALRREAGDAYEMLRGAGQIRADDKFVTDLAKVTQKYTGAAKDFPEFAKNEVTEVADAVLKPEFSSDSAVDLLSILRDKADKAFSSGDKGLGKAYKEIARAVEDVVERNLKTVGKDTLVQQFKNARQLIAKSYSVEKAFNASTGNVSAAKLGAQLGKGAPLSSELATAGRFGEAFPKAAREITDSGSVRNTDVILGAGTAAISREPWWLMYPFARQAVRAGMLSPSGQSLATPGASKGIPPEALMGLLTAEEQARLGLLGQ